MAALQRLRCLFSYSFRLFFDRNAVRLSPEPAAFYTPPPLYWNSPLRSFGPRHGAHFGLFDRCCSGKATLCELGRHHRFTAADSPSRFKKAFGELDSFYAAGDSAPPQHYFVGGLVYFITDYCEVDVRAGVGLNAHADGYLIGTGFAVRYSRETKISTLSSLLPSS